MEKFSSEELQRYSRHFVLPEVGFEGQAKLKSAKVLIVGAGGLGSPVALYLAAAGIGKIGIVDFDTVDLSNLQRQILHSTKEIGKPKVFSAKEKILALNLNVEVEVFQTQLSAENAFEILEHYDVVVDGTDNFPTRYLLNDACVLLKKTLVYGSIFRFEGQVSVFTPENSPCYRCLFPSPPPPYLVQNCAEGGVLGVLPGIVGTIQAAEVLKLILGIGETLVGKILFIDALKMKFAEMNLKKYNECPMCGNNPTIKRLIDYEEFCGVKQGARNSEPGGNEITVFELKQRIDIGENLFLLDVRQPYEYELVNLNGYLLPLNELPNRMNELDRTKEIIVYCHHGTRSGYAVQLLQQEGFQNVKNLLGGIDAWAKEIDTSLFTY
ncbi:MAG: molybdopterin-synthase adenylyltransferase MoeB [Ignavibacteriales bacterium]|nr:molybdopterin-synthase adenylyltransferase MoeB [Ignavibacteriales bacterium]